VINNSELIIMTTLLYNLGIFFFCLVRNNFVMTHIFTMVEKQNKLSFFFIEIPILPGIEPGISSSVGKRLIHPPLLRLKRNVLLPSILSLLTFTSV
jgi:hypothetical protein